jgi:hypothetical protein
MHAPMRPCSAFLGVLLSMTTPVSFAAINMEHSRDAWTFANWDSSPPIPREGGGSTAVMVDDRLLISGSSGMYVFDPDTSEWSQTGAQKPIPCNNDEAAAAYGSKIFYFGGYGKILGNTYECCVDSTAQQCTVSTYPSCVFDFNVVPSHLHPSLHAFTSDLLNC